MFLLEKDKQPRGPQLLRAANRAQTEAAKKKTTAPPARFCPPPLPFRSFARSHASSRCSLTARECGAATDPQPGALRPSQVLGGVWRAETWHTSPAPHGALHDPAPTQAPSKGQS